MGLEDSVDLGMDNLAMVKMLPGAVEGQQSVTLLLVAKPTPPRKTLKGSQGWD